MSRKRNASESEAAADNGTTATEPTPADGTTPTTAPTIPTPANPRRVRKAERDPSLCYGIAEIGDTGTLKRVIATEYTIGRARKTIPLVSQVSGVPIVRLAVYRLKRVA
jgi:hypothetical protein